MSFLTPVVLAILAIAAVLAIFAFSIRSRVMRHATLSAAIVATVLATWLAASDAWDSRDGFTLPSPKLPWDESRGLTAVKLFLLGFWVPLVASASTAALILSSRSRALRHRVFYRAGGAVLSLIIAPLVAITWSATHGVFSRPVLLGFRLTYTALGLVVVVGLLRASVRPKSTSAA